MNIALEMFKLSGTLKEMDFFQYKLTGKGDVNDFFKIASSARYKLQQYNNFEVVFNKDDILYSIKKLEKIPDIEGCVINPPERITLPVQGFESVYSDLLVRYVNENLKSNKKYKIKFNKKILSHNILNRDGKEGSFKSHDINLERVFTFNPIVKSDGQVWLDLSVSSEFTTEKSVYDMMKAGKNIIGLDVKYLWSSIDLSGTITEILDKTISEKLDCFRNQSLIEYFCITNQGYRVNKFTEDDKKAKAVMVLCKGKKEPYAYIPQSLKPVLSREYVKKIDPSFSIKTDGFFKMEMDYRFKVLSSFINDIGKLKQIESVEFLVDSCKNIYNFEFKCNILDPPILVGKNGMKTTRKKIFSIGYYRKPDNKINFGIMYPEGFEEKSKQALRNIWTFNSGYIIDNNNERHRINSEKLMDLSYEKLSFSAYPLGDITEYKRIAYSLKNNKNIDLLLCVIPDEDTDDNPYNPFKEIMAEIGLPSQMISLKSIDKINNCNMENKSIYSYDGLYYLQNISLGMLGKSGGVPWIVDNMCSDVDCFVGLDVGNPGRKNIRYPACSIVFDKFGTLINYFKPKLPQSGEKIIDDILQNIFDKVLLSYHEKYGEYPKHVVIHRDGWARENLEWFKNYFVPKNIKFDIVEVKKTGAIKFGEIDKDYIYNPKPGTYLISSDTAYLVTTDIQPTKNSKNSNRERHIGSPNPLKIQKVYGDSSLEDLVRQIYYLSEIHVGSIRDTRLPVTTGYADRISKFIHFIPEGAIDNRLFFL